MKEAIKRRLEALEGLAQQKPIMVLCRLPTGQLKEVTAAECVDLGGDFIRVTRGNRLEDLDKLINKAYEEAYKMKGTEENEQV